MYTEKYMNHMFAVCKVAQIKPIYVTTTKIRKVKILTTQKFSYDISRH